MTALLISGSQVLALLGSPFPSNLRQVEGPAAFLSQNRSQLVITLKLQPIEILNQLEKDRVPILAEVIWTEPPLNDLHAIADYIALNSPEAARRLVQKIFEHVDHL